MVILKNAAKTILEFLSNRHVQLCDGMASIPLIQNQVVNIHHWLTLTEFTDLITIAEMTRTHFHQFGHLCGNRIAGIPGAIIATIGYVLPSCVIVSLLAWVYFKYSELTVIQGCWFDPLS